MHHVYPSPPRWVELLTHLPVPRVSNRKQLSMVLPPELLAAIKQRAQELHLSTTAYIIRLVRSDLGLPDVRDTRLEERLRLMEERLNNLEQS